MNRLLISISLMTALLFAQTSSAQKPPLTTPAPPPDAAVATAIAQTSDVSQLLALAAESESKMQYNNQVAALKRVLELRPMAGNIQYELAAAYALLNDKRACYDLLLRMQSTGYAFDPSEDERFTRVHGTEAWDYIVLNLQANAIAFGEGKVAMTLPKADTLIESLAWDQQAKQLLVGSVRDGAVYRVSDKGKTLKPFITANAKNQLRSILAMQADNERGFLWLTATGLPHFKNIDKNDYGKTAIYQFNLKTGDLIQRIDMPAANGPHRLDYIHVSKDGRVFAVDSLQKRIYLVEGSGTKLVVQNPKLTFVRGLATSDDGKRLYFADAEYGIFVLDLNTGKAVPLTKPETLTLFGIDGLYFWKGHLVVTQNAFPPSRIMRLKLDASGLNVESSMPLDAGHDAFSALTRGTLHDDELLVIANSQKPNYDRYGLPINQDALEGVKIWQTDLKFALNAQMSKKEIPIKKGL